ncbi:hypothetical protein SAMN05192553_10687 [Cyclobacterium xiamenense]|uniref:Uncharacterized protein n=1 Tax=Cyclobacterium xiamenense TaxID=1297121 RepID=A0A1H7AC66_9BACT|nr:hypothetical protein SAMN05192553_10687 [Cyclobacterium xiamenense]
MRRLPARNLYPSFSDKLDDRIVPKSHFLTKKFCPALKILPVGKTPNQRAKPTWVVAEMRQARTRK